MDMTGSRTSYSTEIASHAAAAISSSVAATAAGESVAGLTEANRVRELAAQLDAWEKRELAGFIARAPERRAEFRTLGGMPLKRVYTALDTVDTPLADIGLPGQFPYTRGPYPTMYRGRLWTMRQIAGFGTAEDTNGRFKYLIEHGQTGLSTDFDMPTLMGYDSDHPLSEGEVGREGVAIDTLADVEHLFDGIDLREISVSMTINPTAWVLLAMYRAHRPAGVGRSAGRRAKPAHQRHGRGVRDSHRRGDEDRAAHATDHRG